MIKFNKFVTGFALGLLVLLTIAASIDYRALDTTQFSNVSTVSVKTAATMTNTFFYSLTPAAKLSLSTSDRWLIDQAGTKVLDWSVYQTYDSGGIFRSANWSTRLLVNNAGFTYLDWSTGNITNQVTTILGGLSLTNHVDVSAGAYSIGNILRLNASKIWTNGPPGWDASETIAGIFAAARMGSITNHTDVSSGSFATGNSWGYDGLTGRWTNGPPRYTGTVTSVAQTVPGQFSVAGSPITTSGTLAITLTNSTGVSNSPIVLSTNATVSGLTKTGLTTNKNVTASSLQMVDSNQVETNAVIGTGLQLTGGVLSRTLQTNAILTVTIAGAVSTGAVGVYPVAGDAFTISGWSITAVGTAPTCTIDVWKIANGTALPTVGNTIMGTKPALASGNVIESTTLTSWTTAVAKGDIWGVNVDAASGATNLVFQIFGYR